MNKIETKNFKRITKQEAYKRFKNYKSLYALPCKINPENMWISAYAFPVFDGHNDFETILSNFEYYSCDSKVGRYAAFYVKKIDGEIAE